MTGVSLRTKFLSIPVVSIFGFLLYSAYSYHLASSNQERLHQIESVQVPILEKANANTIRLEQIEGILNSAVSVGDEFLALDVEPIWASFVSSYQAVGVAGTGQIEEIIASCKEWLDISLPLSLRVIENMHQADQPGFMAEIITQRELANDKLQQCQALSAKFHLQTQSQLSQAAMQVTHKASRGVFYSVLVGILISLISLLLGIWVVQQVLHAFSEIRRSLKGVSFDQGAAGAHIQCHSRDEIGELAVKFNEFIDELEANFEKTAQEQARDRAKTEFMANISHELRTPLNAIIGFSDFGHKNPNQVDSQDFFEKIKFSAHSLLLIVNDLLDVSKLESQGLELMAIPFDPYQVVEELYAQHKALADQKGLHLLFASSSPLPPRVAGDAERLKQIWYNLLDNAIKFCERGAVEFDLSAIEKQGQVELHFSVKDSGQGIKPEQQQTLFNPFALGDASITRAHGGVGQGLYIAKKLAEKMAGDLWLESSGASGSLFCGFVTLPLADPTLVLVPRTVAAEDIASLSGEEALAECKRRLKGTHWLMAEDNRTNQIIAQMLIEDAGATLDIGDDGEEAFALLLKNQYCGLLTDIQMPVLDGFGLTQKVRERDEYKDLPIIAITAHATEGYREKCIAAGMDGYVSKPVEQIKLLSIMATFAPKVDTVDTTEAVAATAATAAAASNTADSVDSADSAAAIKEAAFPQQLPGLELAQALKSMGNQESLLRIVLEEFYNQFKTADQELQDALQQKRWKDAFLLTHTLKGVCGSVGATDLESVVVVLVEALRSPPEGGPEVSLDAEVEQFAVKLKEVNSSIETILGQQG